MEKKTEEIAPGSILQRMFLKQRIDTFKDKSTFLEIGSGTGYLSEIFLKKGWTGVGLDLNESSCKANRTRNNEYINKKKYEVDHLDFFKMTTTRNFDVIFSCMVIEHLSPKDVTSFFEKCKSLLNENGLIISLVPSSMRHWGIEDEVAGHFKRYEFQDFREISKNHNLELIKNLGLTYPVSNMLFRLSNRIVSKAESDKLKLEKQEQTVLSSNRKVMLKTDFPWYFKLILNELTLFPFHLLQQAFSRNPNSMVIYCEMKKTGN